MIALLAYWILLGVGVAAIGFLGLLIAMTIMSGFSEGMADLLSVVCWLIVMAASAALVIRGIVRRREGHMGEALGVLAMLAVPAMLAIGFIVGTAYLFVHSM